MESSFQPNAEGDCDKTTKYGTCVKGSTPHSFCLLQISETNFKGFNTSREEIQSDVGKCVRIGLALMHQSFRICKSLPLDEKLRWYAGGGNGCPVNEDSGRKSKHRMQKAFWLFSKFQF